MFIIRIKNEGYYLHEGPSGYAFGLSKARAKVFPTRKSAVDFSKVVSGDVEVVDMIEEEE